ncbi:phage tail tape measure protein [Aurantimonas sp. 22II-16-19i]|nr:phage tail tape measure protein [Aurantimonas sp. 22II-16-19i]
MAKDIEARLKLTAIDRTRKAFDSVSKNLDRVDKKSAQIEKQNSLLGRAERGMAGYARTAMMAAAPVAAAFGAGDTLKTAAQFETALVGIRKKGDLSARALEKVKSEILGIVESGQVAMNPAEIAEAYQRGIASGIPINEMRDFVVLSAQAADAWEMTGEASGNAFAGFKESLKLTQSEMRPFADLINTLADAGISDERDIVDFLDRTGAQLKDMGMSKENIAALGGTLLDLKMPAEQAATAMNALSTKLLNPKNTKASMQAFDKLYGRTENFTELMKEDANGALIDFLKRLQRLDKFKRTELLTDIVGLEHASKVNRLVSSLDLLQTRMATANDPSQYVGSLGKGYQLKLDTLESKWKVFKANLEKLQIDLGDLIIAPAGDVLGDVTTMVNQLGSAIKGVETSWAALSTAMGGNKSGDFDGPRTLWDKINDPWGVGAQQDADAIAAKTIKALADKSPKSGAVGAMGARDMGGVGLGKALATSTVALRRANGLSPTGQRRDLDAMKANRARMGVSDSDVSDYYKQRYGKTVDPGAIAKPEPKFTPRVMMPDFPGRHGGTPVPQPAPRPGAGFDESRLKIEDPEIQGIDQMRAALLEGGAQLPAKGAEAGAAFSNAAGAALNSQASAAGAAFGGAAARAFNSSVSVPSAGKTGRLPGANKASATTMPDAGQPGGG